MTTDLTTEEASTMEEQRLHRELATALQGQESLQQSLAKRTDDHDALLEENASLRKDVETLRKSLNTALNTCIDGDFDCECDEGWICDNCNAWGDARKSAREALAATEPKEDK